MRVWLAISGGLFAAWAAVLAMSPELLLGESLSNQSGAIIVVAALINVVLALIAGWTTMDPPHHRWGIYLTILALLLKWIADTYGVLVLLQPEAAAVVLGDLLLTVALVVGCLESLPRTLGAQTVS